MRIQLVLLILFAAMGSVVVGKVDSGEQERKDLAVLIKADQESSQPALDHKTEASLWSWFTSYLPGVPSWFNQDALGDYVSTVSSMPKSLWHYVELLPGVAGGALNIVTEKLDETYAFVKGLRLPYASVLTATILSGLAVLKDKGMNVVAVLQEMFDAAYKAAEELGKKISHRVGEIDATKLILMAVATTLIGLVAFGLATVLAPVTTAPALTTAFVSSKSINLFTSSLINKIMSFVVEPMITGSEACPKL